MTPALVLLVSFAAGLLTLLIANRLKRWAGLTIFVIGFLSVGFVRGYVTALEAPLQVAALAGWTCGVVAPRVGRWLLERMRGAAPAENE